MMRKTRSKTAIFVLGLLLVFSTATVFAQSQWKIGVEAIDEEAFEGELGSCSAVPDMSCTDRKLDIILSDTTQTVTEGAIEVDVENFEWSWDFEETYKMTGASVSKGSSNDVVEDTQDEDDGVEYTVESNSDNETEFTFSRSLPSDMSADDIKDYFVHVEGDTGSASANIKAQSSSGTWGNTVGFSEEEEFRVSGGYVKNGKIWLKFTSSEDTAHEVSIDFIEVRFTYEGKKASLQLPEGTEFDPAEILSGQCCDGTCDLEEVEDEEAPIYVKENELTVWPAECLHTEDTVDDYFPSTISVENVEGAVYQLLFSDLTIKKGSGANLSIDSKEAKVRYNQSWKVSAPFPQTFSVGTINPGGVDLIQRTGDEIEIEEAGEEKPYSIIYKEEAASITEYSRYEQLSPSDKGIGWKSTYVLKNEEPSVKNITLIHERLNNASVKEEYIEISGSEGEINIESDEIRINFANLKEETTVKITEYTPSFKVNHTSYEQETDAISIGDKPVFYTQVEVENPYEEKTYRDINVPKKEILKQIPEKAELIGPETKSFSSLSDTESFKVRFNMPAASMKTGSESQKTMVAGEPITWSKTITVSNPSSLKYKNVEWSASPFPFNASLCRLNGQVRSCDTLQESVDLGSGKSKKYTVEYQTSGVEKEILEDKVHGIMNPVFVKRISLNNTLSKMVTVRLETNMTPEVLSPVLSEKEQVLANKKNPGVFQDNDNNNLTDYMVYSVSLPPKTGKELKVKGSVPGTNLAGLIYLPINLVMGIVNFLIGNWWIFIVLILLVVIVGRIRRARAARTQQAPGYTQPPQGQQPPAQQPPEGEEQGVEAPNF